MTKPITYLPNNSHYPSSSTPLSLQPSTFTLFFHDLHVHHPSTFASILPVFSPPLSPLNILIPFVIIPGPSRPNIHIPFAIIPSTFVSNLPSSPQVPHPSTCASILPSSPPFHIHIHFCHHSHVIILTLQPLHPFCHLPHLSTFASLLPSFPCHHPHPSTCASILPSSPPFNIHIHFCHHSHVIILTLQHLHPFCHPPHPSTFTSTFALIPHVIILALQQQIASVLPSSPQPQHSHPLLPLFPCHRPYPSTFANGW